LYQRFDAARRHLHMDLWIHSRVCRDEHHSADHSRLLPRKLLDGPDWQGTRLRLRDGHSTRYGGGHKVARGSRWRSRCEHETNHEHAGTGSHPTLLNRSYAAPGVTPGLVNGPNSTNNPDQIGCDEDRRHDLDTCLQLDVGLSFSPSIRPHAWHARSDRETSRSFRVLAPQTWRR
jgi:hypothetical protein